jgi:hypothetical protein
MTSYTHSVGGIELDDITGKWGQEINNWLSHISIEDAGI